MVFVIFDKFIKFVITSFFEPSLNTLVENGPIARCGNTLVENGPIARCGNTLVENGPIARCGNTLVRMAL